jgi:hypothetical protein
MDKVATKDIRRKKKEEDNNKWAKRIIDLKIVVGRTIIIIA